MASTVDAKSGLSVDGGLDNVSIDTREQYLAADSNDNSKIGGVDAGLPEIAPPVPVTVVDIAPETERPKINGIHPGVNGFQVPKEADLEAAPPPAPMPKTAPPAQRPPAPPAQRPPAPPAPRPPAPPNGFFIPKEADIIPPELEQLPPADQEYAEPNLPLPPPPPEIIYANADLKSKTGETNQVIGQLDENPYADVLDNDADVLYEETV